MQEHVFLGKWITDSEFAKMEARNVFHRQLDRVALPCEEHLDRHILFRKSFSLAKKPDHAMIYITADDYYKLYINGVFVTQGPAPSYPSAYCYNTVDITEYLSEGRNVIAVHTLYQGLINRVWVSGDYRHGMICDIEVDGEIVVSSDESFLTQVHSAYTPVGTVGYATQFLETYDSRADEVGFEAADFDDSGWGNASLREFTDYNLVPQPTKMLEFENIASVMTEMRGDRLFIDFGAMYVGYLDAAVKGKCGDTVVIRCAQELNDDGEVRQKLRANCNYEESWILSGGCDKLDWFDYKSFRYAELTLPEGCEVLSVSFSARHYPFTEAAKIRSEYAGNEKLESIWKLCVNSQKYGVQEVIQDCMEREKGFYVGDGCYTALVHLILTGDDSIVRRLIDEAFHSTFITPGMVTCLDCSFMQEIAEYPLMLISLILWHYRLCGDTEYLRKNYEGVKALLEVYRKDYEKNGLLSELDKWCVVEWPGNYRDGYDVDIREGKVCHPPHVALNAYYIEAIRCANKIAAAVGEEPYRDEKELTDAFTEAFYNRERHQFRDSTETEHISYIGNVLPFAFMLSPDEECEKALENFIDERGLTGVMLFGALPLLCGLIRRGRYDKVKEMLLDEGGWLRMLGEGATTTFEGWGKDTKSNASLFHLTMTDAAIFLSDIDLDLLFS